MGIADRRDAARKQVAALGQQLDDFRVRLARLAALLAGGPDDIEALQRLWKLRMLINTIGVDDIANVVKFVDFDV